MWNKYKLTDGTEIAVGKQNFIDDTVAITYPDGHVEHHPMFQDEDGDIGFTVGSDVVYFTHLT